jgi:uncharacterized protein
MLHVWTVLSALLGAVYPPHQDEFVNDFAGVIEPADAARIRAAAKASLDRGVPIVAATIRRLADQGAADWSIERYATNLYNEWGLGDRATNRGVLLLVSVADRKLRIATGTGLGNRDGASRQVIDGIIVPRFKSGDFSGGIAEGVEAISRWFVPAAAAAPAAAPTPPAEMPPEGLPPERVPNGEGGRWNPHGTGVIRNTERGGGIGMVFKILLIVVGIGILLFIFRRKSPAAAGPAGPTAWSGGSSGGGSGWGGVLLGGLAGFLGSQLLSGGRRNREWGGGSSGGSGWPGGGGFSGGGGGGGFSGGGGGGGSSFGGGSSSGGGASGTW